MPASRGDFWEFPNENLGNQYFWIIHRVAPVPPAGGLIGAHAHSHENDLWFLISADKWARVGAGESYSLVVAGGWWWGMHVARIINLKAAYHICSLYNYAFYSNGRQPQSPPENPP